MLPGRGGVGSGAHSPGEYWVNVDGHLAIQRALANAGGGRVGGERGGLDPFDMDGTEGSGRWVGG